MYRNRLTKLLLALALVSIQPSAQAEYRDAIDLPSIQAEAAKHSLLLDITQAGDQLITVGERGHILLSDDHGAHWTQGQAPTRLQLNTLTFVDPSTGWAAGEDSIILRTDDGGKTWSHQYDGRDAETKGPLLGLQFRNAQEGFAIGVYNKIFHTEDGGKNWIDWAEHVDNLDEWHLFAITATGPSRDRLYIASEKGLIFRSTDGGDSFEAIDTGHYGSFHAIAAQRGANGQDRIVLAGVGGVMYTSGDGGESWTQIDTGTDLGLAAVIWLDDGGALAAGAGGTLIRLAPNLRDAQPLYTQNGESLSALIQLDAQQALLVGFGGLHPFTLQ